MVSEKDWLKIRDGLENASTVSSEKKIGIWEALDYPIPPPSAYKQRTVREYAARLGIKNLVETGTWHGDMIKACLNHFDHIYSIELGEKLAARALKKFAKHRHLKIMQGDSGLLLPAILKALNGPAIFWLDAHYSAGDTVKGEAVTPIQAELAAILGSPISEHVILIDDARVFVGRNDYPTIQAVGEQVREKRPTANFAVEHDIIRVTPSKSK